MPSTKTKSKRHERYISFFRLLGTTCVVSTEHVSAATRVQLFLARETCYVLFGAKSRNFRSEGSDLSNLQRDPPQGTGGICAAIAARNAPDYCLAKPSFRIDFSSLLSRSLNIFGNGIIKWYMRYNAYYYELVLSPFCNKLNIRIILYLL